MSAIGDTLRKLAAIYDEHPEMERWYGSNWGQWSSRHLPGDAAIGLAEMAALFEVDVQHCSPHADGATFSVVDVAVNGVELRLQAHTEDFEKAVADREAAREIPPGDCLQCDLITKARGAE